MSFVKTPWWHSNSGVKHSKVLPSRSRAYHGMRAELHRVCTQRVLQPHFLSNIPKLWKLQFEVLEPFLKTSRSSSSSLLFEGENNEWHYCPPQCSVLHCRDKWAWSGHSGIFITPQFTIPQLSGLCCATTHCSPASNIRWHLPPFFDYTMLRHNFRFLPLFLSRVEEHQHSNAQRRSAQISTDLFLLWRHSRAALFFHHPSASLVTHSKINPQLTPHPSPKPPPKNRKESNNQQLCSKLSWLTAML